MALKGSDFAYYDLAARKRGGEIGLLMPGWRAGDERVAIFSPHDDDAVLGAGVAALAAQANGAEVHVFVFCDGRAGYSRPQEKATIVERRRAETEAAYGVLGVGGDRIVRFEYPDFSVPAHIGWVMPWGEEGSFARTIPMMRERRITRVVVPNGYREHVDHEAVCRIGAYDGPQVGDSILAEWGEADAVRSYLEYAVWGDFSPEDALVAGRSAGLRGNVVVRAPRAAEELLREAIRRFESQERVIEGIMRARDDKRVGEDVIEAYLRFDARPPLCYGPYKDVVAEMDERGG